MYTIKFLITYVRFLIKSNYIKFTNAGVVKFLGFVNIAPMVTVRVPKEGKLIVGGDTAILQNTFIYSEGEVTIGEKVLINRNCYIECMEK